MNYEILHFVISVTLLSTSSRCVHFLLWYCLSGITRSVELCSRSSNSRMTETKKEMDDIDFWSHETLNLAIGQGNLKTCAVLLHLVVCIDIKFFESFHLMILNIHKHSFLICKNAVYSLWRHRYQGDTRKLSL